MIRKQRPRTLLNRGCALGAGRWPQLRKARRTRLRNHSTYHKLVLVARNQADRLRQNIEKPGHFVKAGRGLNSTGRDTL
jgi:hypothetical protein